MAKKEIDVGLSEEQKVSRDVYVKRKLFHLCEYINRVLDEEDVEVFVETGTGTGETVREVVRICPRIKEIFTIELSDILFRYNLLQDQNKIPKIRFLFGDSPNILRKIQPELRRRCIFYLDAHYTIKYGEDTAVRERFPLWEELEIIRERDFSDIVIVDDVHNFGKSKPYSGKDKFAWVGVTEASLLDFMKPNSYGAINDAFVMKT